MEGIVFLSQNWDLAGRGIAGARLRTAAEKAGYEIAVCDILGYISQKQIFDIIDAVITPNTKFIGFSVSWIALEYETNRNWYNVDFFNNLTARYPSLLVITGGHQSFGFRNMILKYSDYHFNGFSDVSFVEFLKKINGLSNELVHHRSLINKGYFIDSDNAHPVLNPDSIETVFRKSDGFESYQPVPIEISRGCIFRCTFCKHPFQGKKSYDDYQRTPENIANELRRNYDLFGTTRYTILDDTFNDSIEKLDRLEKAIELAKLPKFEFVSYIKPELLVTKQEMIPKLANLGLRGAYIGFESFKNQTRKIIGKGTNIEKVKEACFKLAEQNNRQVRINGSFIVGLPHETPDDLYQTYDFLMNNVDSFCRSWQFQSLLIRKDTSSQSSLQSEFDKNPEKYGYTATPNTRTWSSAFFTDITATELTTKLNKQSENKQYIGGWSIAGCWQIDKSEDFINNSLYYPHEFTAELRKSKFDRAQAFCKSLPKSILGQM